MTSSTPWRNRARQRDHLLEGPGGEHRAQRGPHGREGERVAGQGPSDAAGVLVVRVDLGQHLADGVAGNAQRAGGHAAPDGLAHRDHVRFQAPGRGAAAGPGRQGVRLVDDQQRAGGPGDLTERLVVARSGQDDAHIGHGRLGQHAGDRAVRQRRFQLGGVIELDRDRGLGRVCRRSHVALAGDGGAAGPAHRERFIHRAVVAVAEDQHFGPPGDLPGDAQRRPVGVRGTQREQPVRHPEPAAEFLGHPDRVLGRQHGRDAPLRLGSHRGQHGRRSVTGHRPRVAQAEIHVLVPIHIRQAGPRCAGRERGETARPAHHPGHRHATDEGALPAAEQLRGHRVLIGEPAQFPVGQFRQPLPADRAGRGSPVVHHSSSAVPGQLIRLLSRSQATISVLLASYRAVFRTIGPAVNGRPAAVRAGRAAGRAGRARGW